MRAIRLTLLWLGILLAIMPAISPHAKQAFTIGVVADFDDNQYSDLLGATYTDELSDLVSSEFELNFKQMPLDWSNGDLDAQIEALYQNSEIDMLLVTGIAANQIFVLRSTFPKPTFLPFVIERELIGAPYKDGVSAKKNLSYLSYRTQFLDSVSYLRSVVPFNNAVLISDEVLMRVLSPVIIQSAEGRNGLSMLPISHDGVDDDLLPRIPDGTDAVVFGYLPRMLDDRFAGLIKALTERGIPTFSYLEEGLIEKGLLATPINQSLYQYAARRNALNMQAVMLGEPASRQPIDVDTKSKLTINQATAERLGVAIDFKILVDADVVGFGAGVQEERLGLLEITEIALRRNLDLKNEQYNVEIQQNEKRVAKSSLLPQLSLGATALKRKDDSALVQSGFASEDSTDVALNLSQTVFSDSQRSNYRIQSLLADASDAQFQQVQLDIVREASLALADILQAQAEAAIQQENLSFSEKNLELAKDRVSLGASSAADQYRWETQAANAKSAVFDSFSRVLITKQNLNRILNRNISEPVEVEDVDMDSLMVYRSNEIFDILDNTASFEKIYQVGLGAAYEFSPEIKRFESLLAAKRREIAALKRRNWLPEFSLTGQLSENVDRSGVDPTGGDSQDWQVMLNANLPFYAGGEIRSRYKKGTLELAQIENNLAAFKLRVAQNLRAAMNNVLTTLFNLQFSSNAADAASRSLALVTDAYSKGAVPIVDLLDAQNASISANLAQVQASIGFFRSNIEMQRSIGVYEFLMSDEEKQDVRNRLDAGFSNN